MGGLDFAAPRENRDEQGVFYERRGSFQSKIVFPRKTGPRWARTAGCGGEDFEIYDPERGRKLFRGIVFVTNDRILKYMTPRGDGFFP